MLDQISPSRLDNYEKLVRKYHERYGRQCWPVIYQADVRARLEQVERLRRRGMEAKDAATRAGAHHDFDNNKPWEWVWDALTQDAAFWHREVEEPCILLLARTASLSQLVGEDAAVEADGSKPAAKSTAASPANNDKRSVPAPPPVASFKRQRGPDQREHRLGEDGLFTHNRRGVELCKMFQSGECVECDKRGFCSRNPQRRHQCAKCLSEFHGASRCPTDAPRAPRPNHGGKGRGKRGKR